MGEATLTNLRLVLASRILAASRKEDMAAALQELLHLYAVLPDEDGETDGEHLARVSRATLLLGAALDAKPKT